MIYFAYGSNLDEDQMRSRCAGARAIARATLPSHALAFGGFSHRWGGAVASVVRAKGASVEGVLYRLETADVRELDRFEGHPHVYRRVRRVVVDERGERCRAAVYLLPARRLEATSPSAEYLDVLRRAYARWGFDEAAIQRTRVFVYGTLLSGEPNHRLLAKARLIGPAKTRPEFELRDLGAFPGMVRSGSAAVAGELYEVDAATLAALDRLEGHPRFYRRSKIQLASGDVVDAYLLSPEQVAGCTVIASGSWRRR